MKITRRAEFSASHYCGLAGRSEEENRALYGEGANRHGHGHNYILEVTLEGEPDPVTGMVMDLKLLKDVVNQEVVEPMDHRFLNYEVPPFDRIVPTAENVAREVWRRIEPRLRLPNARLSSVRIFETDDMWAEYSGPSVD